MPVGAAGSDACLGYLDSIVALCQTADLLTPGVEANGQFCCQSLSWLEQPPPTAPPSPECSHSPTRQRGTNTSWRSKVTAVALCPVDVDAPQENTPGN